ncbi:MAG: hypothetical protein ACREIA_26960 [Opitutaceae bacterium]
MPSKRERSEIRSIRPRHAPVVEITGEGSATYIWFNRTGKHARTIEISKWPVLLVDLDARGEVIGVETAGFREFTINAVLKKAGLKAPADLLKRTRYVHAVSAEAASAAV